MKAIRAVLAAFVLMGPLAAAAVAQTQDQPMLPFAGPLHLSRGDVTSTTEGSAYFSDAEACRIATEDWGWADCSGIDALTMLVVPGVEAVLFELPNSDGHVDMSDWASGDKDAVIRDIEAALRDGLKAQGEKLGMAVTFTGWRVYPTLVADQHFMYYATEANWGGQPNINIKASVFDRGGYVPISIVPISINPSEAEVRGLVEATIAQYHASAGQDYASFVPGDAVSSVGALGVLAALVGVKLSKVAGGGLIVLLLAFLKKGLVLVLLPLGWLMKKLKGGGNS